MNGPERHGRPPAAAVHALAHAYAAPAVRLTRMAGGTRVVSEAVAGVRSVAVGIWVGVGGREESPAVAGVSHFLEHLVFRGSAAYSAREAAVAVDRVGGELNAYTTKEYTVFYLRVPEAGLAVALELLCDLVAAPLLADQDVASERSVILEELAACDDNPEDVAERALFERAFPDHSLGWDVIGLGASVAAMSAESVREFHERWYRPDNIVLAACGAVDHDALVAAAARLDGARPPAGERPVRTPPAPVESARVIERRPSEQGQLALGWRIKGHADADRATRDVLEQVLGGGPASRLFQEVREDRALAYSVFAASTEFADCGLLTVNAGVSPQRAGEALEVISSVIEDIAANGITGEELSTAQGYLEGSYWMGLEGVAARMSRLGWWLTATGSVPELEAYTSQLEAVTVADVARLASEIFSGPQLTVVVGPVKERMLRSANARRARAR
ncbi:MAG: insulinase family protein [Acidimicrobiia bacterium]|nr:insulinase family protein [Acidimicrobiia bacterium]